MEREEFKKLVKGMKAVYAQPTFIPDQDAFNMWFALMGDLQYEVAAMAVKKYMLTNKFPPTVAELRELASGIVNGEPMSWVTFAAELGTLVAAGYFIYEYFRERSNDNNADA